MKKLIAIFSLFALTSCMLPASAHTVIIREQQPGYYSHHANFAPYGNYSVREHYVTTYPQRHDEKIIITNTYVAPQHNIAPPAPQPHMAPPPPAPHQHHKHNSTSNTVGAIAAGAIMGGLVAAILH